MWFPLARLVETEIVSPYYGILINTNVGNPTVPIGRTPRSQASPKRLRGGRLIFTLFIKGTRLFLFSFSCSIKSASRLEFQHPKLRFRHFGPSTMSGSNLQGWWMPSSIMEEDTKKLREARYLTAEISHRLPARGQAIPTPEPNENVVFVSHFLRGGLALDPFVRGLMFYYGLDFHDLGPN